MGQESPQKQPAPASASSSSSPFCIGPKFKARASPGSDSCNLPSPGTIGPGQCGTSIRRKRICSSGGTISDLMRYPWTALLVYRYSNHGIEDFFECGGSLISDWYVLTSAHCVDSLNETYTLSYIRLGEWDLSTSKDCIHSGSKQICIDPPQNVAIEKIIRHSKFSRVNFHNDIALIKLRHGVTFTRTVLPVCLPTSRKVLKAPINKLTFTLVGWGATEHRNETKHYQSRHKTEVYLPGVQTLSCKRHHRRRIVGSQLCAGGELGKDACLGDSGGGLVIARSGYYYLYGIVSYGHEICELGFPGVYTKVTSFLEWIRDNMD